jgi:hypothetical protein
VQARLAILDYLEEKSSAIADRWLTEALAAYPADSAAAFRREQDPFANPVGHALREGTRVALHALLQGRAPAEISAHLDDILKMRAVQEIKPSQAISFVFLLKEAIRTELRNEEGSPEFFRELAGLDRQIDEVALAAFDLYLGYRSQVYELRVREVKRSVAVLAERLGNCSNRGYLASRDRKGAGECVDIPSAPLWSRLAEAPEEQTQNCRSPLPVEDEVLAQLGTSKSVLAQRGSGQ